MEPTYQDLLDRIVALEERLSDSTLTLRDAEGRVRVRLSDVDGLQLLDAAGSVRAKLRVDTHSTRLEMSGTSGAKMHITTAGSESVLFVGGKQMHWYLGLHQDYAIQRMTDENGVSRFEFDVPGDHACLTVRSADDQWVRIHTVTGHPGNILIKTSPDEAWSAPELQSKQIAYGSSKTEFNFDNPNLIEKDDDIPEIVDD